MTILWIVSIGYAHPNAVGPNFPWDYHPLQAKFLGTLSSWSRVGSFCGRMIRIMGNTLYFFCSPENNSYQVVHNFKVRHLINGVFEIIRCEGSPPPLKKKRNAHLIRIWPNSVLAKFGPKWIFIVLPIVILLNIKKRILQGRPASLSEILTLDMCPNDIMCTCKII